MVCLADMFKLKIKAGVCLHLRIGLVHQGSWMNERTDSGPNDIVLPDCFPEKISLNTGWGAKMSFSVQSQSKSVRP